MNYKLFSGVASIFLLSITALMMFGCSGGSDGGWFPALNNPSPTGQLQSTIQRVDIPADGKPLVTFSLFDQNGQPLDPTVLVAAGGKFRAYISRLDDTDNYWNYFVIDANQGNGSMNPVSDTRRVLPEQFTTVGKGQYTYKFVNSITTTPPPVGSPGYDPTKTHTIALQIEMQSVGSIGKAITVSADPYLNYRPDGQPVTKTHELVPVEACNECHGTFGYEHGGERREMALCVLCHNPAGAVSMLDPTFDLKSLIHKIHMGPKLTPNIAVGIDYSTKAYPFWTADSNTTKTPVKCVKCHRFGKDLAGRSYGKNVDLWKAAPTKTNCESCHVQVFIGPVAGVSVDHTVFTSATDCTGCHASSANKYTSTATPNVEGAHAILEETPSVVTGINLQILSVTNSAAAGSGFIPKVSFKVTDNAGTPIDPRVASTEGLYGLKLAYIESTGTPPVAGVNYLNNGLISTRNFGQPTEFTINNPSTGPVTDKGNGVYEVTFPTGIPNGKTGVGVVGLDGGRSYPRVTPKYPTATKVRLHGKPALYFFDLTTGAQISDPALQRRKVVDVEKCKSCHYSLLLAHGAARNDAQYCAICHNPNAALIATTTTVPPVTLKTLDFKEIIHQIHASVAYSQDLKNCLACHINADTFRIPPKPGVFGFFTSPGYTGDQLNLPLDTMRKTPIVEVCSTCHASGMSNNPAYIVNGAETCAQCHSSGMPLGVDAAHKEPRSFPKHY